jgi:hypothetical protein
MSEPFDKTDEVIARKLAEITPPADLRARLLAIDAEPAEEVPSVNWWARGITAVAAAVVVAFTIFSVWPKSGDSMSAATADLSNMLSHGFELDMKAQNSAEVREWLATNNPEHPVDLPSALAANSPIGCRELMWRDHRGTLACFQLGDGREAHLAMFPEDTFSDSPGGTPLVASAGKWTRAAWSRNGMTYLLFVPAGMDPVKEFLSILADQRFGKIASSNLRSSAWPSVKISSGVARIVSALWT